MKDKVIIVGHGASGKDHLSDHLVNNGFVKNVSYTTRPMRSNEIEGITYIFISVDEFKEKIAADYWHEYNIFKEDWYYGSSREQFESSNLFIKEPHGISLLSEEERNRCFIIYVNIDESIRRERLSTRNDADSVTRRLDGDAKDFENFSDYDMMISNPTFEPQSVMFRIMRETNIKALSTVVRKEMFVHNAYITYTENNRDYISFEKFFNKIENDNAFAEKYKDLLLREKSGYFN